MADFYVKLEIMKYIGLFLSAFLLTSCASQNISKESIELKHENVMVIKGDRLVIILVPTTSKRKRSVIVKTLKNNEQYDRRRISQLEYTKISAIILKTSQEDIELPKHPNKVIAITDGGSNSITLRKDSIEKKLYTRGISKEYHGNFYEATMLILKAAKMPADNIN